MENSSSGFKIKSLAKTTAREQELGALMDLLHKKKKKAKREGGCCHVSCVQTSLLSPGSWGQARSVSACWLAPRREKEGSGELSSLLSRGRRRVGPGSTGQGFLSSQSVIYFVWFVSGASQKASTPQAAGIIGNEQPWPVKVALPC